MRRNIPTVTFGKKEEEYTERQERDLPVSLLRWQHYLDLLLDSVNCWRLGDGERLHSVGNAHPQKELKNLRRSTLTAVPELWSCQQCRASPSLSPKEACFAQLSLSFFLSSLLFSHSSIHFFRRRCPAPSQVKRIRDRRNEAKRKKERPGGV